jgi:hypothetical protein
VSTNDRKNRIESYANAYDTLVRGLESFPRAMWHFKPSPERWSIHEIIVHIADSEANSYVRCRRFVAEPGSTLMGYDEMQWARALDYSMQSCDDALELFRWLRLSSSRLISHLPESAWTHTAYHTENGIMTLDDWLRVYERHIPEHLAQMRENHEAWLRYSG